MRRVRALAGLSPKEWVILAEASVLLPATALGVRTIGFRRWTAYLIKHSPDPSIPLKDRPSNIVRRQFSICRIVRAASIRGPFRANCLQHSVVLWWLLCHNGIESHLRIGARKQEDVFEAHAWVELEGEALNDSPDVRKRFAPFQGELMYTEVYTQ